MRHLENESVPHKESQKIPALQVLAPANRFSRLANLPDGHLVLRFINSVTYLWPTRDSMTRSFSLLTQNEFKDLAALAALKRNVMAFQARYQRAAKPFK